MYNPIVNMLRERQELASHDDDHHSPWRRREPGDVDVRRQDIRQFDGADYIPTHTYGLHPGKDRKTPTDHLAPRRPLAGVPVLGAVADFMGNLESVLCIVCHGQNEAK